MWSFICTIFSFALNWFIKKPSNDEKLGKAEVTNQQLEAENELLRKQNETAINQYDASKHFHDGTF